MKKLYKRDLAVRYFPHERPDTARRKLKFEIAIRPRLRQRFRKLQPNELSKFYSESEILAIKKYPGVPPFVSLIIFLIETCLTFYSGLSSESTEQQLPECAYQTKWESMNLPSIAIISIANKYIHVSSCELVCRSLISTCYGI